MNHRVLLSLLLFWLTVFQVLATDTPFFSTLSIRDGLPSNIISAVAQDNHEM